MIIGLDRVGIEASLSHVLSSDAKFKKKTRFLARNRCVLSSNATIKKTRF